VTGEAYEGSANHETWCVNMWLHSEEPFYRRALDMADDERRRGDAANPHNLAERYKEWVTDDLAPDLGASFASDLLTSALGNVNWHEIAEDFLGEIREVMS
jgi:hypothetical protein